MDHFDDEGKSGISEHFDPVTLTLALWLGTIATVTGGLRLIEHASAQAAIIQSDAGQAARRPEALAATPDANPFAISMMAF